MTVTQVSMITVIDGQLIFPAALISFSGFSQMQSATVYANYRKVLLDGLSLYKILIWTRDH